MSSTATSCLNEPPVSAPSVPTGPHEETIEHHIPTGHGSGVSAFNVDDTPVGAASVHLHNAASLIALPLMTVFICAEVIMRYVFNAALFWSQEACGICMFVLVLCCQANCWQQDRHIRMDLLYNHAPAWFRKIADTLSILSGSIFFGAIGIQALRDVPYQLAVNESTDEMHIPLWLLSGIVIVSCSLVVGVLARYSFKLASGRKEASP